jgi:hypothetical protein
LVAVLYGLGARLVNRWTGVAALLVVLTAVVFVHLSRGYPDLIALAFVGLALLALMQAQDTLHSSPRRGVAWLLLAGGALGWAFLVRELTLLAWPALGVALLRVGRPRVALPAFGAPVLAALGLDVYLNWRVFDDPWLRLRLLSGNSIAESSVAADDIYVGHDRWYYLTIPFQILGDRSAGPALLISMGVGLIGGAILLRRLSPVWFWGASGFALLWMLGGALRPAAPSIRLDIVRYNLAYAVPLALTGACVLAIRILAGRGWRRAAVALVAAALALGTVVPTARFVRSFEGLAPNGGDSLREMGDFLAGYPELQSVRIWSDWATQRLIPIYSVGPFGGDARWEAGNVRSLNRLLRDPAPPARRFPRAGDLVVLYSQDDQTCYHCHEALAEVEAALGQLPMSNWQQVFRSRAGNLTVYRLSGALTGSVSGVSARGPY